MDIKDNLAKNLTKYRKASGLTQAELAKKLNYSDKAVSKWERGESAPDLFIIYEIAKLYNVKIDTLLSEPKEEKPKNLINLSKKRAIICLLITGLVWLVAICCYSFISIIIPSLTQTWLAFIYAIPVTCIILLIFTGVWGKNLTTTILLSITIWTVILSIFLSFNLYTTSPSNLWLIFLIGIPLQAIVIFWLFYARIKKNSNQ